MKTFSKNLKTQFMLFFRGNRKFIISTVNVKFSKDLCNNNPTSLFVFGDNTTRIGYGGQAVIRGCKNSVGLATKFKPSSEDDAFFTDDKFDIIKFIIEKDIKNIKEKAILNNYSNIVFSVNGYGSGFAALDIKAPKVYDYLSKRLNEEFGYINPPKRTEV